MVGAPSIVPEVVRGYAYTGSPARVPFGLGPCGRSYSPPLAATQNTIGSTPLAGRDVVALLRSSALPRTFFCRAQRPDEASAVPR